MKRNIWPYAIIAYFVVFIGGIVAWVTFAMRNDDQLVRPDYYAHEIQYQDQIDKETRTAALGSGVSVNYDFHAKELRILVPRAAGPRELTGTIHLYRPSNATLDKSIPLALDATNSQTIDVASLQDGLWKVRLSWTGGTNEYYFEKSVILGANYP